MPTDLAGLPEKWRAKAQEALGWADQLAGWDGANRHELRNRSGVYNQCADELAAALVAEWTTGQVDQIGAAFDTAIRLDVPRSEFLARVREILAVGGGKISGAREC